MLLPPMIAPPTTPAPPLVEEVGSWEALGALEADWWDLWERTPFATPFQSPAWVLPWCLHFGRGRLRTLALRRGDVLVGLAPFYTASYFGLPLRRLALAGTGNTDYLDLLLDPDDREQTLLAVEQRLASWSREWDFCDFQQLRGNSALLSLTAPPGTGSELREQEVTPFLPLPENIPEFHTQLPPRLRSNLRYYRRRLEREGSATFSVATTDTQRADLQALFELHRSRWRGRGLPGVFTSSRVRDFHQEVCRRMLERGWLRLHTLRFDGRIVAALYCFQCGNRCYYYAGGFEPALSRLSPGTVLTGHAMEQAIREGCAEWDFLRGGEAYKYAWGASDRVNRRLLVWNARFPGSLAPRLNRWERALEKRIKAFAAERIRRSAKTREEKGDGTG